MSKNAASATPNTVLFHLRSAAGLSQHDVAEQINALAETNGRTGVAVTANAVSRWERGIVTPAPFYRRLLAALFAVSVEELGFVLQRGEGGPKAVQPLRYLDSEDVSVDPRVAHSQQGWRRTRRALNAQRPALTQRAIQVYDPSVRMADTGLIVHPGWLPAEPLDLAAIDLAYRSETPPPDLDGTEPETSHVRPRASLVRRYQRYTQAIRDLDPPRLFDNRPSWRLLDLSWERDKGRMVFGPTTYFAGVDTYEAAAHEIAYVHLTGDGKLAPGQPLLRDLPFRKLIGDPFNLVRRPVLPSIDTLTIRRGPDGASFLLHRRDPSRVAVAGGMLQVIPSGVFQPSSVLPAAIEEDFDLWRNMMREYSEELLGNPEHDGDGRPMRYDEEPFRSLDRARAEGQATAWCLGVALDALTLVGEILTVVVFDADFFDELAGNFVDVNDEGSVVGARIPFTEKGVHEVLSSGRIAPAGAGCIRLAWQHRDRILSY
jgi:transcriptional regulator with XRE-family HTH domain